ncbi:MAG: HD domain-containing protein [Ignavibacteriales bacterium]
MWEQVTNSFERTFVEDLTTLQWNNALKAYKMVKREMCQKNGYTRDDGSDYYIHCVAVAMTLINMGVRNEDTITAAILHDLVEDMPEYTIKIIERLFNARVARLVDLVTKKPNIDYKIPENMRAYLNAIAEDSEAAIIKTADRMHNFSTLRGCDPKKKMKQVEETEIYFFPFFKQCRKSYPQYTKIFIEAKSQIMPHLEEIKDHYAELAKAQAELARVQAELDNALSELAQLKKAV